MRKLEDKLKWYAGEFEEINSKIDSKDFLSHYDFLRIRNFKLQNLSVADERHIEDVTKKAFDLAKQDKIEESVKKLVELDGVRVPIASAILAMRFPEKYAIIDKRVITQLKKDGYIKKSEKEK
ncbi:MAG: hypothetical protein MUO73_04380, partial [Thermoplasmata archaeon]|nr:hypothetical protein [Thermoplasmata archaeon]